MRKFSQVSPRFWVGTTGRKLRSMGSDVQVLAMYLMTAPSSNMIGLYYLPVPTISHETGLPIEAVPKGLARLTDAGFARYDETDETVWVIEMARHQLGDRLKPTDKRRGGVERELQTYVTSRFYASFLGRYAQPFGLEHLLTDEGASKVPARDPSLSPSQSRSPSPSPSPGEGSGEGGDIERARADALAFAGVEELRGLTGGHFNHRASATQEAFVEIRAAEPDITADLVREVVRSKHAEWSGGELASNLKPGTLFKPSNFLRYLSDLGAPAPMRSRGRRGLSADEVEAASEDLKARGM